MKFAGRVWLGMMVLVWLGCFEHVYIPTEPSVNLGAVASRDWESDYQSLLQQYVHPTAGLVDYRGLLGAKSKLDAILVALQTVDLGGWQNERRLAFWINVYNAAMIWNILETMRIQGEDVFGKHKVIDFQDVLFERRKFVVAGLSLSLNDVEHGMLRREPTRLKRWKDGLAVDMLRPEIHIAISCAALSCPPIRNVLWKAETVMQDLRTGFQHVLNQTRFAALDENDNTPKVTRLVDWFFDDFKWEGQTVGAFLGSWITDPRLKMALQQAGDDKTKYVFFDYDWTLNLWQR